MLERQSPQRHSRQRQSPQRPSRQRPSSSHRSALPAAPAALAVVALAATLAASGVASAAPARTLVVPPATRGKVRAIYLKRITVGITRTLSFGGRVKVTKDSDRPAAKGRAGALGARKATKLEKRIEEADRVRLQGMDLEAKDAFKAYALYKKAIKLYESAAAELVDMTKLADAYTRAGLAAYKNRAGTNNVKAWFKKGLALQPTLVINRRGQDPKLLALFDKTVAKMTGGKKVGVEVVGDYPGATCYVDGVKVGPLPARKSGMIRGNHFVQLRGPGIEPWGKIVFIGKPNFTVKAKAKKKKAGKKKSVIELTVGDLSACADKGLFTKKACNKAVKHLQKQTDSQFVLFTLIKADRYGRLALHPFLVGTAKKKGRRAPVVSLKAVPVKKNLSDLNAQLTEFATIVGKATAAFPKDRALSKVPRAFSD